MQLDSTVSLNTVRDVLVDTLGVQNQADALNADTRLFGSLPELDSMAVLEVLLALEQRFGITIEGEDVTVEAFESLGNLTDFVSRHVR
jgi:acyl carrier protein